MHTVHNLWVYLKVSSFWFLVNRPPKADNSKIIRLNSCVAFGCTDRSRSGVVFHKIPCDEERQKL